MRFCIGRHHTMYLANKIIAKRTHRWHSKLVLEMQCPEDAATADLRAWGVTDEDSPNSCPEGFLWASFRPRLSARFCGG